MTTPDYAFARFDSATFLRDCWQKKPAIIRDPWTDWTNPLEPDELAGLACESEVESRLVEQVDGEFLLEHGPLALARFGKLGGSPWTLLVQAVDHHVPAVGALRELFGFLPEWRIDDVMVSYATDGGGVGPHFDQYDVFLIQGLGRRKWRVGGRCDDASALLPHEELRLLAHFTATEEWLLEPGDILYIPPGFAHEGTAVGDDCMTYSVGFRAPSRRELIVGFSETIVDNLAEGERYCDPEPLAEETRGEIGPKTLARLQAMMAKALLDRDEFARWFGEFTTQPRNTDIDWRPTDPVTTDEVLEQFAVGMALTRNPAMRLAFIRREAAAADLFVDGECYACEGALAAFAELCCAQSRIVPTPALAASPAILDLLVELVNQGALAFELHD